MAYTHPTDPIIVEAYGKFKMVAYTALKEGAPIAFDTTNDGLILADAATPNYCRGFAIQKAKAGDQCWCAQRVVMECRTGVLATAGMEGDPLYLSDAGIFATAAGSTTLPIGFILSTTRMLLTNLVEPTSGATATYTSDVSVGGTFGVTGATTLGGAVTHSGTLTQTGVATFAAADVHQAGVTINTLKTLNMAATNYTTGATAVTPKGFATITGAAAITALTLAAGAPGDIFGIYSRTAYAHVITAGAGITFNGTHAIATFSGAVNDGMLLICISTTLWVVLTKTGITFS
jgi:hypothetical protein